MAVLYFFTARTYEARLFYDGTYNLIDTVEFDVNSSSNDCGTLPV